MSDDKARSYKGNPPPKSEGWWHYDCTTDIGDAEWDIFCRRQEHSDEWVTFKICAEGRVPRKANYWTARNIETGQMGFTKDMAAMKEHRPELYEWVMESIEDFGS